MELKNKHVFFTAQAYLEKQSTKLRTCNSTFDENPSQYIVHFMHNNSFATQGNEILKEILSTEMGFYTFGTKIPLGRFTAHAYRHIQFTKSRPCNSPLGENPAEYTVHLVHQNSSPQRGNGPLTRYAKLRVAHVPGMLGTFSPPPTSKAIASQRSRHAPRHVRTLVP